MRLTALIPVRAIIDCFAINRRYCHGTPETLRSQRRVCEADVLEGIEIFVRLPAMLVDCGMLPRGGKTYVVGGTVDGVF